MSDGTGRNGPQLLQHLAETSDWLRTAVERLTRELGEIREHLARADNVPARIDGLASKNERLEERIRTLETNAAVTVTRVGFVAGGISLAVTLVGGGVVTGIVYALTRGG